MENLSITSPVGLLLPRNLPAIENAFTMRFFISEETFGKLIPRLILFYPWSVCLGFAGIAVCFIALQEKQLSWKLIGFCGGVLAVFGSMSRAAVIALLRRGCSVRMANLASQVSLGDYQLDQRYCDNVCISGCAGAAKCFAVL